MGHSEVTTEEIFVNAMAYLATINDPDKEQSARDFARCEVSELTAESFFIDDSSEVQFTGQFEMCLRVPSDLYAGMRRDADRIRDLRRDSYNDPFMEQCSMGRIWNAVEAVLPHRGWLESIDVKAFVVHGETTALQDFVRALLVKDITNQGPHRQDQIRASWNGLNFRSQTEVKIAQALDARGVLFFPLPAARVSVGESRRTMEPDFVICSRGRWGVLEVDGLPFHRDTAAADHQRDRWLKEYGVRVVERFDGDHCFQNPDLVVQRFLDLLHRNG